MARVPRSLLVGTSMTLLLWGLGRVDILAKSVRLSFTPGEAVGAAMFGHDHPFWLFLATMAATVCLWSSLWYGVGRVVDLLRRRGVGSLHSSPGRRN